MQTHQELLIPIPATVIDHLARRIAVEIIDQLLPVLNRPAVPPGAEQPEIDRPEPTLLRLSDLVERLGVSRSTIYQWMEQGRFPQSVNLGARSVAWRRVDIEAWESQLGTSRKC